MVGFFRVNNQSEIKDVLFGDGYRCEFTDSKAVDAGNYWETVECLVDNLPPGEYPLSMRVSNYTGYAKIAEVGKNFSATGKSFSLKVHPVITEIS
jgi:hypothetical protein